MLRGNAALPSRHVLGFGGSIAAAWIWVMMYFVVNILFES